MPGGAGRPLSGKDIANSINYATSAHYAPPGALAQVQNGVSLVSTFIYNNRLQPCWMYTTTGTVLPWGNATQCTSTATTGNTLDLKYDFGWSVADNGNVNGITNNRDTTRSQSFTYDQVNRIATAETSSTSGSHCWGEKFGYDQWADLLSIGVASTSYNGCTQENLSLSVNASNQISSPSGYVYDYAGNLTTGSASYTYNAENEVTLAQGVTYTYDGDGKRVQKSNGKLYWYGMGSDSIAESDLSGNITDEYVFFAGKRIAHRKSSGEVDYYFADHLGTSRIVTNAKPPRQRAEQPSVYKVPQRMELQFRARHS